jgi:hypothetical protein
VTAGLAAAAGEAEAGAIRAADAPNAMASDSADVRMRLEGIKSPIDIAGRALSSRCAQMVPEAISHPGRHG